MSFEVSELALKYAPWSISKASMAETCPAQFEFRHVKKTAEGPASSDTRVGTAAHTVLELRVIGTPAAEARKQALEHTPLTSNEQEDLQALDEPIEGFLVKFDKFCREQGVTQVIREAPWGMTRDALPAGFYDDDVFFRGKLDLCALTRDRDLVMLDYKSGKAKNIRVGTRFRRQLNSYAVLALVNMEDLAGVRSGIHFLQGDEAQRTQWLDYLPAAKIRESYIQWLFNHLNETASTLVAPFVAKPGRKWPCGWCSYKNLCPAYQGTVNG